MNHTLDPYLDHQIKKLQQYHNKLKHKNLPFILLE